MFFNKAFTLICFGVLTLMSPCRGHEQSSVPSDIASNIVLKRATCQQGLLLGAAWLEEYEQACKNYRLLVVGWLGLACGGAYALWRFWPEKEYTPSSYSDTAALHDWHSWHKEQSSLRGMITSTLKMSCALSISAFLYTLCSKACDRGSSIAQAFFSPGIVHATVRQQLVAEFTSVLFNCQTLFDMMMHEHALLVMYPGDTADVVRQQVLNDLINAHSMLITKAQELVAGTWMLSKLGSDKECMAGLVTHKRVCDVLIPFINLYSGQFEVYLQAYAAAHPSPDTGKLADLITALSKKTAVIMLGDCGASCMQ